MRQYYLIAFQRNDLSRWALVARRWPRDVSGGVPPTADSLSRDDYKVWMRGQRPAGGDGSAVFTNLSSRDNDRPRGLTYSGLLYFSTRGRGSCPRRLGSNTEVPKSPYRWATASPSYRCWLEQRLDLDEDEIARFLFEVAPLFLDRT